MLSTSTKIVLLLTPSSTQTIQPPPPPNACRFQVFIKHLASKQHSHYLGAVEFNHGPNSSSLAVENSRAAACHDLGDARARNRLAGAVAVPADVLQEKRNHMSALDQRSKIQRKRLLW